jgi:predicted MFS family arabinose efflux permease
MQPSIATTEPGNGMGAWRATLSGFCASLVGIGFSRFAYTPLIPALIATEWFVPSQAAYLGAANFAGYLAGALLVRPMALRGTALVVLRTMMLLATASFFACAYPLSFLWFFVWRFASGFAGGALIVLAPVTVVPHVPPARRGFASGVIFAGMGLGIVASAILVPPLLRWGLVETWFGFGALSLLFTLLSWGGWPREQERTGVAPAPTQSRRLASSPALIAVFVAFALNAVGLVPHMIFLVDFIARGLGQGLDVGAHYWMLFGFGAIFGPMTWGYIADHIGFKFALQLAYLIEAMALFLIAISDYTASLIVSSFLVGGFVPGIASLVLGRIYELVTDNDQRRKAFSIATAAFGIGQALAGYGFSYIFAQTGGAYSLLFVIGAAALVLALGATMVQGAARVTRDERWF